MRPAVISRTFPEWLLSFLSLVAGGVIGCSADQRLAVYLVWHPGLSLSAIILVWALAFCAVGVSRMGLLAWCRRQEPSCEGVCHICPMAGHCVAQRWRPRLALLGTLLWTLLTCSLAAGDSFPLAAALAGCLAAGNLLIFSALSAHSPWITSFR